MNNLPRAFALPCFPSNAFLLSLIMAQHAFLALARSVILLLSLARTPQHALPRLAAFSLPSLLPTSQFIYHHLPTLCHHHPAFHAVFPLPAFYHHHPNKPFLAWQAGGEWETDMDATPFHSPYSALYAFYLAYVTQAFSSSHFYLPAYLLPAHKHYPSYGHVLLWCLWHVLCMLDMGLEHAYTLYAAVL